MEKHKGKDYGRRGRERGQGGENESGSFLSESYFK